MIVYECAEYESVCEFSGFKCKFLILFNYPAQVNNATARVQTKKAPVVPNGTYSLKRYLYVYISCY